jgi:hypothetical protein
MTEGAAAGVNVPGAGLSDGAGMSGGGGGVTTVVLPPQPESSNVRKRATKARRRWATDVVNLCTGTPLDGLKSQFHKDLLLKV